MRKIRIFSPESIEVPRRAGSPEQPVESTEIEEEAPRVEVLHRRAPDMPVRMVEADYEADLAGVVNPRMALEAQQEGFDAVIINCYNEPGANATKEVCDIPVVTSPGASMAIASILGNKFSIIISLGGGRGKAGGIGRTAIMDVVKHYGFEQKLASIRAIDLPPPAFNEEIATEQDLEQLRKAVFDEATSAVNEDSADVIISYGGPKVNEYLQQKMPDVPIVDSHGCTVIMAEALVRLGLRHSKRAYPKPRELFKYYLRKN